MFAGVCTSSQVAMLFDQVVIPVNMYACKAEHVHVCACVYVNMQLCGDGCERSYAGR